MQSRKDKINSNYITERLVISSFDTSVILIAFVWYSALAIESVLVPPKK